MTDKQIIIDGVDVSGCNRLNTFPMRYGIEPHEICLTSLEQWGGQEIYCKDRPNCYYKQLKRKEQECERLNLKIIELKAMNETLKNECENCEQLEAYKMEAEEGKEINAELKAELNSAKELREYTYDCCKRAGEELAKNSFEWDGKEKNLVVQAMELNERYDQLKAELEAYKMEAEEGKEINAELKAENEELKEALNEGCLHNLTLMTEQRVLLQTLTEIKPILELYANSKIGEEQPDGTYKYSGKYSGKYIESNGLVCINYDPRPAIEGLKKISECEVEDGV